MAEQSCEGGGGLGRPRSRMSRRIASGRLRSGLTVLALILAAPGCYSYTQVAPAAVPPGSSVRLRVDPRVPLKVGVVPLPDGGRVIRGTLLPGSTPDTLLCSVPLTNGDPRTTPRGLRGTVLVPLAEVQRLEVRRLAKGRTAALVGAGGLLGLVVLNWAFDVTNPNTVSGDGGGGGNNVRAGLFRLRW